MDGFFVPLGEQLEDQAAMESIPTSDKVIALINEAQMVDKINKMQCLNQVKELIINKEPELLDSFLDEVIAFQADNSPEVRKFVVTFMEEACKRDPGLLVRVVPIVAYMMGDDSTIVVKRLLSSIIQIYRLVLLYITKLKAIDNDIREMWEVMTDIKQKVCEKIESDNDGVRTICLKFMEILILAHTKKEPNSEATKVSEIDISLDMIPVSHPLLNPAELREEAGTTMGSLLEMTASPIISSVNLMTCVISLATVAKHRPSFITIVVQAFELLHANLPQHFATSQISSVRKQLKTQILSVLRQPSSFECREQITTLLTDLGCTQVEIARNTPKVSHETMKRARVDAESAAAVKKLRSSRVFEFSTSSSTLATMKEKASSPEGGPRENKPQLLPGAAVLEATEMTTEDLISLLTPETVTELVIESMKNVPSMQPKMFGHSYTPIAAAGTVAQVKHLARLLASQMTSAGIGVGAEAKNIKPTPKGSESLASMDSSPVVRDPRKRRREKSLEEESVKIKEEEPQTPNLTLEKSMAELSLLGSLLGLPNIMDPMFPLAYATFFSPSTISSGPVEPVSSIVSSNLVAIPTSPSAPPEDVKDAKDKEKWKLQAIIPQKPKRIRKFDLASLAKPLEMGDMQEMTISSFKRILESEKNFAHRGGAASLARIKLIVNLVTLFNNFNSTLLEFILEDIRGRFDIAMAWLYSNYSALEGYIPHNQDGMSYNTCLTSLMNGAKAKLGPKDRLFTKLVLEAPRITPDALNIIILYCHDEDRAFLGISTLKELVLRRPHGPSGTEDFLQVLLQITISDIELARIQSMHIAKKFYSKPELAMRIEKFALQKLQLLLQDHPMFEEQIMDMEVATDWTEASVKVCFSLFVSLLPLNHRLLRDLAFVYTSTTSTVKRIILRQLDKPVRSIGMNSPDLLQLVENCPQGGETLIMRMLHILTEGAAPSPELVSKVRELYRQNSSDARFLIPVLHGLTKQEVILALPKFIKLSPTLVKGVFDRLLIFHGSDQSRSMSPITPSELLIALHNIYCVDDEALIKCVIKASNLCFQEKSVFTQEVLAVVLQQLLEQDPIPVLFMRTVLQSLNAFPKLISFVMTILVKLISKQVWKHPKVWQGFIKCCEMTKPHSYQVLLQLPPQPLDTFLKSCPGMSFSLRSYVQKLPHHQLASVQRSLLQVLERYSDVGGGEIEVKKLKKRRPSSKSEKGEK